jgi:methylamine dehydrogenase accessory protein MauD
MVYTQLGATGARMTNMGPALGSQIVPIRAVTVGGLEILVGGPKPKYSLLMFVSPGCASCTKLAPSFADLERREGDVELILIGRGDGNSDREYLNQNHLSHLKYVASPDLHSAYGITGTPYAILLDQYGAVLSKGLVNTAMHIESLLNTIDNPREQRDHRSGPVRPVSTAVLK